MAEGTCRCCKRPKCSINQDGTVRYHLTDKPECQDPEDASSRKCAGVGKPPVEAGDPEPGEPTGYVCRVPAGPTGCGRVVQLTANRRARSHLNPQGEKCSGGSDWPLAVDARGNKTDTRPADGRTTEQQDEIDRRMADPVGTALASLEPYDPQDPDGPGEPMSDAASIFDPVHRYDDGEGGVWEHPGEAADCRLAECCTHPQGFAYVDDDNGHSGDFCPLCGASWDYTQELGAPDGWKCPADVLALMPEEVVTLAATEPVCWDCGHEVTPLAERFEQSGKVRHVVWDCETHCAHGRGHIGQPCRPQAPWQERLGKLPRGSFFRRHQAKGALSALVYRAETEPGAEIIQATIVSAGAHHGRVGELTNPSEEITCTDHNGQRLRRPTLSAPAVPEPQPTPARSRARRSTPAGTATATPRPATKGARSGKGTSSAPTETAAGSTRDVLMTDAFSTPKDAAVPDKDRYDRYGRYKLQHPKVPTKKVQWTRATTFAKSIQDTFALSQWAQRMTLKGAALRPDITAAAGTLEVKADKDRLNDLVEDAKRAAGDKVAANLGTAVHSYTEHRDKGTDVLIPEEHVPTVDAYEAVLKAFGLEPVPGLIEFTTAVLQFEIAGTSDRCYRVTRDITFDLNGRPVTLYAGEYVIGDVKTGADLSYGWQEIAIQLAIYAQGLNTCGTWSWATRTWSRPTDPAQPDVQIQVRTDVAVVPHLPVDRSTTGAPLATLYAVDIAAGWAACILCGNVREWRKESTLATPLKVADVSDSRVAAVAPRTQRATRKAAPAAKAPAEAATVEAREPTLEERAQAVRNRAEASTVFQAARTAKGMTPARLNELTAIMQAKLKSHVEQGA